MQNLTKSYSFTQNTPLSHTLCLANRNSFAKNRQLSLRNSKLSESKSFQNSNLAAQEYQITTVKIKTFDNPFMNQSLSHKNELYRPNSASCLLKQNLKIRNFTETIVKPTNFLSNIARFRLSLKSARNNKLQKLRDLENFKGIIVQNSPTIKKPIISPKIRISRARKLQDMVRTGVYSSGKLSQQKISLIKDVEKLIMKGKSMGIVGLRSTPLNSARQQNNLQKTMIIELKNTAIKSRALQFLKIESVKHYLS